jgi:Family of unknown function (DUF6516)
MEAEQLYDERYPIGEEEFVEMVIWRLPRQLPGSAHRFKYRMALVVGNECVLRYDNEAGKGDHRHVRKRQTPYRFVDPDTLIEDFWRDVEEMRRQP